MPTCSGTRPLAARRLVLAGCAVVASLAPVVAQPPGTAGPNTAGGVIIDPQGVLHMQSVADPGLTRERRAAAVEALPGDLRKSVPLRKVALARLEAALATRTAGNGGVPDDIEKLAGLTRVQYVFVYPAEGDMPGEIVIAGPAEPWFTDATGRVRGVESGRPTLLLTDLA
ncbi:MAG: hypothetical protein FJ284_11665, partial [Planctomycetes bacterium]|nr:hypothetical protein [Planctomycetota bacterium]